MKLKKITTIALAGTMALGLLSACGSNTNDANSTPRFWKLSSPSWQNRASPWKLWNSMTM